MKKFFAFLFFFILYESLWGSQLLVLLCFLIWSRHLFSFCGCDDGDAQGVRRRATQTLHSPVPSSSPRNSVQSTTVHLGIFKIVLWCPRLACQGRSWPRVLSVAAGRLSANPVILPSLTPNSTPFSPITALTSPITPQSPQHHGSIFSGPWPDPSASAQADSAFCFLGGVHLLGVIGSQTHTRA